MRLLLDAHLDRVVARALREHGYDVISVVEIGSDLFQAPDAEILAFASAERRAFGTRNIRDFVLLHAMWLGQERSHAGIVLVHARNIPEGDRGREIRALENLLQSHPKTEELADTLLWLRATK